ncbi:hypothetical protein BABINDRAFT_40072 [Babjeviella inositovora NRRL Y-12698]|uniref:VHS domain-containing protein n=1 Tax=Babjeviella inositovora NRRL Y-12698 TaxID=984486 RepID=A0A1E3QKU1_9ASCO|nr:uncharacterized protein BABINDRAFT_40072 [Babjeviella inositovora NRRL Y-12698]ODQ78295.1 hypothetical protein BABINDRAFT_40072 [Babjeviella inositovora NRRL Y-12698]
MLQPSSSGNARLIRRIHRACRPTLHEPDLALNLEICDYVNEKQGSAPRDAAVAIVRLINGYDPAVSELALALLDHLVKNCGYPFHLQISRKEFLNEFVKKFPERPPPRYLRPQRQILAYIEEWYQTICRSSKYKDDLGFIKDMHRLLAYKGYVFPELKREDLAVLQPSENLKSVTEIQKEEKIAHSAKLQELIRRGKPNDLKEANKLMKIMAGFKDDEVLAQNKTIVHEDLQKLKRKVDLFRDMLTTVEAQGGKIDDSDDTLNELYSAVKVAKPKITMIIEEEQEDSEDPAKVTELLELNDAINGLMQKYQMMKYGKTEGDSAPVQSLNTQSLNLIDFDDDPPVGAAQETSINDLLSDLSSLSFSNTNNVNTNMALNNFGTGGLIDLNSLYNRLAVASPVPAQSDPFGLAFPTSQTASPALVQSDPFGLAFPAQASPSPAQLDPFRLAFPASSPASVSQADPFGAASPVKVLSESANLKVIYSKAQGSRYDLQLTSKSTVALGNVTFMAAPPKKFSLQLQPPSATDLNAGSGVINQSMVLGGASPSDAVKIKWKISYVLNGANVEETGITVLE